MSTNKAVTIRDVAAAAQVNASTVSRILRKPEPGASATGLRVVKAAAELGYQPNLVARALTKQVFPMVPLLIPDVRNSFFPEIAWGAEEAARAAGYYLVLCNTGGSVELERQYLESFSRIHVPFVVAAPATQGSADVLREFAGTLPMVVIDQLIDNLEAASVTTDNQGGAAAATRHLIELGHTRIVCVRGPSDAWTASERVAGYEMAMESAGLQSTVLPGGFARRSGRRAAAMFLGRSSRPTAVVAANDYCAIGFAHELQMQGVRVPEDVSIVGFDDLELAAFGNPPLTTVHQPARKLGKRAVETALIPQTLPRTRVQLRCRLVKRESTAPPRIDRSS